MVVGANTRALSLRINDYEFEKVSTAGPSATAPKARLFKCLLNCYNAANRLLKYECVV